MFDAQKLLGSMIKQATGSTIGQSSKVALGMGALGVAMAAFEHFTQKPNESSQTNQAQIPASPGSSNNTMPPPAPNTQAKAPPPPPPPSAPVSTPPPSPEPNTEEQASSDSLFLIDAMLAAANADGEIDQEERSNIFNQLKQIGSDDEGFDYLQKRLAEPPSLGTICAKQMNNELAKQVYVVSLLAIKVDNQSEENYLQNLAACLQLETNTIEELNQQFKTTA